MEDVCFLPATELSRLLLRKEVSAREVADAHLRQVERVNPALNAIVTVTAELAMDEAKRADDALARGEPLGPLHGLPVVHKDLFATKGVRTTKGSPIYSGWVPAADDLPVARIRAAGAVMLGKTNTPEFGAGSQTFNPVFGATHNPYDLSKTCGGSSGGAAVALAGGMATLATGSDVGGSLRNPAAFCNVAGLRPSLNRVPGKPGWPTLEVSGPMARTVADLALLLSVMAGPDASSPASLETPGELFRAPLARDFRGVRVAWSPTLGGLPVEREVSAVLEQAVPVFESLGCVVDPADPPLARAPEVFGVLRALMYERDFGALLDAHREQLKDTVVWNIEQGRALTGPEIASAQNLRVATHEAVRAFMQPYQFLLCPVTQVLPFGIGVPYPAAINGKRMTTYIEWMRSCTDISILGWPALSVPAGFTASGLPVGLQIVGCWRDDFGVLQLGHAFEQATQHWRRRPPGAGPAN